MHESNEAARNTWEVRAVGSHRAGSSEKGSLGYFQKIRAYRYGYETPFIPKTFKFDCLNGKRVLEIGVGNGIDAVEMMRHGALYTGIDITENHLDLTRRYVSLSSCEDRLEGLIHGDLLQKEMSGKYDVVYSFGVLHHIAHEREYLEKIFTFMQPDGELRIAVYSKWSLFNAYLVTTWFLKNRCRNTLDDWRSHLAEMSDLGSPVTIKIRSRRKVERLLHEAGFSVFHYEKRGFVQNYLPVVGRRLRPDGPALATCARLMGWYHCFIAKPSRLAT